MKAYIDASAAMKLVIIEGETLALQRYLHEIDDAAIFSSVLLETELRRGAEASGASQAEATSVLSGVALVDAPRVLFREAGLLRAPGLRSLDALHLATALRNDAQVMVTYDRRLLRAAEQVGLSTVAPA